jgi:hypothetical protein
MISEPMVHLAQNGHLMVLLGEEDQVEARFSRFADSANLNATFVHCLHQRYHRLRKMFGSHKMKLLGDVGHVKSRFSLFGDSVSASAI